MSRPEPARTRQHRAAVVATIPSDSHTWNLVFLQLLLEEQGYTVHNLGACTPVETTVRACTETGADLLVVSSVNGHGRREGGALISALRRRPELRSLPAVIGGMLTTGGADGPAAGELHAAGFDRVFLGPDAESAFLSYLADLAGRPPRTRPLQALPATAPPGAPADAPLGPFVAARAAAGELVVQPRMGFGAVEQMRAGLAAVHDAAATTVGTLTLDSYTRVGDVEGAARALASGAELNGYPLLAHGPRTTREMLDGLAGPDFPVQVRHGSALPSAIVAGALASGLGATEGGPVSYCLPYSRVPLEASVRDWRRSCRLLAEHPGAHLESFGGCMLGQLCPPSLLVALSLLECLFFQANGLRSVSLSYAQQTSAQQDREALAALRRLAREHLAGLDWHVVVYTYMGVFPRTAEGATALLRESAKLAVAGGAERLIVKTAAESRKIPTISENVAALESSHRAARDYRSRFPDSFPDSSGGEVYAEAKILVERVMNLSDDIGDALSEAFRRGFLDVPYCLHADNHNRARTRLLPDGRLRWAATGAMPLTADPEPGRSGDAAGSRELLRMLGWLRDRYDTGPAAAGPGPRPDRPEGALAAAASGT